MNLKGLDGWHSKKQFYLQPLLFCSVANLQFIEECSGVERPRPTCIKNAAVSDSNLISHAFSFPSALSVGSCPIIYLIHFGSIQFCLFVQLSLMGQVSGLFLISIGCGINNPANTSPSQQLSCHYFMLLLETSAEIS